MSDNDLISRKAAIEAMEKSEWGYLWECEQVINVVKDLPPAEPERTAKVTDTWKVAGSDELNAWCPECEHRITRGCQYCPTCGAKLDWSNDE